MPFSRHGQPSAPQVDRRLKHQVARVCGLVESLMFDVAAWLAGAEQPVTPQLNAGYLFNELRRLPSPRDRMRHYVSEDLLESWGEVMDRWLAYGATLMLFASLHYLFTPPLGSDYVSQGDFLRVIAYDVLMVGAWRAIRHADSGDHFNG